MRLFKRNPAGAAPTPTIYENDRPIASRIGGQGQAMMDKATRFYRENPKTVGGIALIAGAALLGLVKNRGLPKA